mgnify:CR=1 FL=1
MRHVTCLLYNLLMGGVDRVDRNTTSTDPTTCLAFKSWEAAMIVTLLQKGCFHNGTQSMRVVACEEWLSPEKWKGPVHFLAKLREVGTTKNLLLTMAKEVLATGGVRPRAPARQAAEGGFDGTIEITDTMDAGAAMEFAEELRGKGTRERKRLLTTVAGQRYRTSQIVKHTPVKQRSRKPCVFCTRHVQKPLTADNTRLIAATASPERQRKRRRLLADNRHRVGSTSVFQCNACGVNLCVRKDCFAKWHAGEQPTAPTVLEN